MATLNEKLKEVLGDSFTTELETKIGNVGKHVAYFWDKDNKEAKDLEPIPKFRVNEMLEVSKSKSEELLAQVATLESQAKDYDKQLKELKKSAEGNPDLIKQIETLQLSNKEQKESFEQEKLNLSKKTLDNQKHLAVLEMLMDNDVLKPTHRTMLAREIELSIGLDKIELDEIGKVKKSDEIMKPYKENPDYSGFIGKTVAKGQAHVQGELDMSGDLFTHEQLKSLTKEQLLDPKVMAKADKSYAAIGKV